MESKKTGDWLNQRVIDEKTKRPFDNYVDWNAKTGELRITSAEAPEEGEKRAIIHHDYNKEPFGFFLLNQFTIIKQKNKKMPFITSERFYNGKTVLTFRQKNGDRFTEIFKGAYSDQETKNFAKSNGLTYERNLIFLTTKYGLCSMKLTGNALWAWYDFSKEFNFIDNPVISIGSNYKIENDFEKGTFLFMPMLKPGNFDPSKHPLWVAERLKKSTLIDWLDENIIERRPTPEPTPEATTEPAPEATTEPAPEATTEPAPEATTEPAPEATTEPAPEATTEPAPEATTEPAPEATTEPAPEATTEPAQNETTSVDDIEF